MGEVVAFRRSKQRDLTKVATVSAYGVILLNERYGLWLHGKSNKRDLERLKDLLNDKTFRNEFRDHITFHRKPA